MNEEQSTEQEKPKDDSSTGVQQEEIESNEADDQNEEHNSSEEENVEKPKLRKLVSAPKELVEKTVKTGANLTKKAVTTTTKNVAKVVKPIRRNRSPSESDDGDNTPMGDENEERPDLAKEPSFLKCATDALGKPITGAEKALERPGGRKYAKVDRDDTEDAAHPGNPMEYVKEALEKPVVEVVEVEQGFQRPDRRKYVKVDRPVSEPLLTTEAEGDTAQETDSVKFDNSSGRSLLEIPAQTPEEAAKEIEVGPFVSFLLRDSTIMVGLAVAFATTPTFVYWSSIGQNQIPLAVSIGWVVAAYIIGEELGRSRGSRSIKYRDDAVTKRRHSIGSGKTERSHSMFRRATRKLSHTTFKFPEEEELPPKRRRYRFLRGVRMPRFRKKRETWRDHMKPSESSPLLQWLNSDPSIQRRPSMESAQMEAAPTGDSVSSMGAFDLSSSPAKSLSGHVVEPLLDLLGMDIFLTDEDGPEDDLSSHPFLVENGLRENNTCLVNVMLPWANMLIYFRLPDWFEDWDSIVVNESDPNDVKVLKRFLNGTDEYRQKRLKLLPALVEGPRMIKILAPKKAELALPKNLLPVTYNKVEGESDKNGSRQCPLIEVELDFMSNKAIRSMAGVFKNHFHKITLDLAVLIREPDDSDGEASACLGMWRFDKIDVSSCPVMPMRDVQEEDVLRRASVMMSMPQQQMTVIAQEA